MVIIVIIMTLVSLVAPLSIKTINKAKAQTEYIQLHNTITKLSNHAFLNGSPIFLELRDNELRAQINGNVLTQRTFEYLNFSENQSFRFDRNGLPSKNSIDLSQIDSKRVLYFDLSYASN
jgi:hypothetical protein